MSAWLAILARMEQPVHQLAMGQPASVQPTSKESIATKMLMNVPKIPARTEALAQTLTEATSAHVTADSLERIAIKM